MSRPQKTYNPDESAALLRGARGHWAGGVARWIVHTGCTRADACRLRWGDLAWVEKSHPLYAELRERRRLAAEIALANGVPLDGMRVFLNFYQQRMNPTTLADRLREMLLRGQNGGNDEPEHEPVHTRKHARGR